MMPASMFSSFSSNYVPYGMNYAMTGEEAFQYTGKLLDEATGLYYEGARYYDPTTGRFVTEDSVVGSTSDPQSLNRYVYARDNPMKIIDMNGHGWWDPVADLTTAAFDVAGAATNLANEASNAWNSLPPSEQQAIEVTAIVAISAVAVVATAGLAAPAVAAADAAGVTTIIGAGAATTAGGMAIGAAASSAVTLGVGLAEGNANPQGVVTSAVLGAFGGGLSGVAKSVLPAAARGLGTFLVGQAAAGAQTSLLQVWMVW